MTERVAVYPGSFDPLTNGHLDIIERARQLCDRLVPALLVNDEKKPLFSVEQRTRMIGEHVGKGRGAAVEVREFSGLLVEFAHSIGARMIVRGLRAMSDFEYEFQMALMNRRLAPNVETVFLMAKEEYSYVSSRLVKEVARLGGDVSGLTPPGVNEALKKAFRLGGP
ncbi:MAG: pantetheine-phosphate adenylyltransferase [Thermoanaerobaculia bacterium]